MPVHIMLDLVIIVVGSAFLLNYFLHSGNNVTSDTPPQPPSERLSDLREVSITFWKDSEHTHGRRKGTVLLLKEEVLPFLMRLFVTYVSSPETELCGEPLHMLDGIGVYRLERDTIYEQLQESGYRWKWIEHFDPRDQQEADEHCLHMYSFNLEAVRIWLKNHDIESPEAAPFWKK